MPIEETTRLKVTKAELKKQSQFATSGTSLLFQGTFYDQIDSAAMGSALGPVLSFRISRI